MGIRKLWQDLLMKFYKIIHISLQKGNSIYELHEIRRNRPDLKINTNILKRSILAQKFGWGIHFDSQGRIALI